MNFDAKDDTEAAIARCLDLTISPRMNAFYRVTIDAGRFSGNGGRGFPEDIKEGELFFDAEAYGRGGAVLHGYARTPKLALERLAEALRLSAASSADDMEKRAYDDLERVRELRTLVEDDAWSPGANPDVRTGHDG